MYGFGPNGKVQSEAHRRDCLAWIDQHLNNPSVLLSTDDALYLDELRDYIESAPSLT